MDPHFRIDSLEEMLRTCGAPETPQPIIRPIRDMAELRQVYRLHHDCYVASGYCEPHPTGIIVSNPQYDLLEETTILVAVINKKIIGSVSLTLDGPGGFPFEDKFKASCNAIRQEGKKCGALWRLLVEESAQSQRVVISLMIAVRDFVLHEKIATVLLAVNPNQENIYQRLLNTSVVTHSESTQFIPPGRWLLLRFDTGKVPVESPISPEKIKPDPHFHPVRSFIMDNPEEGGSQ